MDFTYTPQEEAFRTEVRDWLAENMRELPAWWGKPGVLSPELDSDEYRQFSLWWHGKLYKAGFVGIAWPKEYGGRGATLIEQAIFSEEIARHRAPGPSNAIGIGWAGPTIIAAGTGEQKKRFLPKILTAEEIWAQAFSEPEAGSDLAGIQTRAVEDGDDFVVNGQKWPTGAAERGDWAILLVRTDPNAPKHRGISYLILDMHAPGVTVQPFKWMDGDSSNCLVFLDNVRIPKTMLVGQKNMGFYVAMGTLEFERSQLGATVGRENIITDLVNFMKATKQDGQPLSRDPVFRQELAQHWIETRVMKYMGLRMLTSQLKGEVTGPKSNLSFVMAGESIQRLQDFATRVMGPYCELARGSKFAVDNGRWLRSYLSSRGVPTIGGGPVEIKRNIIAMRLLGLPRSY
jgi:alkylation response protein AidB-like acyl-CoA dehydrogenase